MTLLDDLLSFAELTDCVSHASMPFSCGRPPTYMDEPGMNGSAVIL